LPAGRIPRRPKAEWSEEPSFEVEAIFSTAAPNR
jgi:hypothetical protein